MTALRPDGADLCVRTRYRLNLRSPIDVGEDAPADVPLTIGQQEHRHIRAVVFPAARATAAACGNTEGYLDMRDGPTANASF